MEEEDLNIDSAEKHKLCLLLDKENLHPDEVVEFEDFIRTTELIGQAIDLAQSHL